MHDFRGELRQAGAGYRRENFIGRGSISSSGCCPSSSSSSSFAPPFSNAGTAQAVYTDKTAIFSEDGPHTPVQPYPSSLQEIPFPFSDCLLGSTPPVLPFLVFHTREAALGMLQTEISAASSLPPHPAIGLMASRWQMRLAPSAVCLALQGWEWDLMALHTRCCQTHVSDCIRVAGLRKLTLWCLFSNPWWPEFIRNRQILEKGHPRWFFSLKWRIWTIIHKSYTYVTAHISICWN